MYVRTLTLNKPWEGFEKTVEEYDFKLKFKDGCTCRWMKYAVVSGCKTRQDWTHQKGGKGQGSAGTRCLQVDGWTDG